MTGKTIEALSEKLDLLIEAVGRLAPGLRGDVVLVDPATPAPMAVFAGGRLGWLAPSAETRIAR